MTVGQKLSEISKHWIKNRDNLMKVNACGFSGFAMLAMSAPPEKNCGQFLVFCQYINRNKKNRGPFLIVVSKTSNSTTHKVYYPKNPSALIQR